MNALAVLGIVWAAAALLMAGLWWIQRRGGNANLVDVGWAAGTGGAALLCAALAAGDPTRRALLALFAGLWAFRLAKHIFLRVHGAAEDGRYQNLRAYWTRQTQLKFFFFYQAQALSIVLFATAFIVVAATPAPLPAWALALATLIWLVAVGGEAVADQQLAAWRADPANRGRACRAGLWRYSRHPNYFFEWVHWWTYVPLAWGSPVWWLSGLAQGAMLAALFKFTGIPHTERQALASRGDDYRAYQRSTSVFIPWFPKEET